MTYIKCYKNEFRYQTWWKYKSIICQKSDKPRQFYSNYEKKEEEKNIFFKRNLK